LPDLFRWKELKYRQVFLGAAIGGYSHIVLDSIMHSDIRPYAPFSESNPLLNVVTLGALHWSCVLAGVVGLALMHISKR